MTQTATDVALGRLLALGRDRAERSGADHAALWDALEAATEGGKRFRPLLVTSTHDALGGSRPDAAATIGAAVELLHTAFVVHDDVIDDDHVRRGRPNVSGTFRSAATTAGADPAGADHYGLTAGVLAGDLALAAAVRAVATSGAPPAVVEQLLDLLDAALHTTAAGELADVRLTLLASDPTLEDSLDMEAQKTAAYSFALPLQAGAVLAGAPAATVRALGEAGHAMGAAFQLVDDLLGVFGDPEVTGKSTTCDLRARKQTPLLVHARTTAQWAAVEGHLGRELPAAELEEVRALLVASGSRAFVEELVEQRLAEARDLLTVAGLPLSLLDVVGTVGTAAAAPTGRRGAAA